MKERADDLKQFLVVSFSVRKSPHTPDLNSRTVQAISTPTLAYAFLALAMYGKLRGF